MKEGIPTGEEVIRQVREECGPKVFLSFSRGKDALGAYIALRRVFDEIVPYHLYSVPGLGFVDESLAYYEKVLGTKIYNLPHPSLYRQLNAFVFQTPARAAVIHAAKLPKFDYLDIHKMVCEAEGVAWNKVFSGTGVRAADSPQRRVAIENHGPMNRNRRTFAPVWDWNKARLVEEITASGIKLPVDYLWFGRSFDGLDLRFLYPIKQHAPADYRRILEWFPLAEAELWAYEKFGTNASRAGSRRKVAANG